MCELWSTFDPGPRYYTADLYAHHERTKGWTDERRYLMAYEQIVADDW
jgi:hypothetical protein